MKTRLNGIAAAVAAGVASVIVAGSAVARTPAAYGDSEAKTLDTRIGTRDASPDNELDTRVSSLDESDFGMLDTFNSPGLGIIIR